MAVASTTLLNGGATAHVCKDGNIRRLIRLPHPIFPSLARKVRALVPGCKPIKAPLVHPVNAWCTKYWIILIGEVSLL
jgi:hypothetical protein